MAFVKDIRVMKEEQHKRDTLDPPMAMVKPTTPLNMNTKKVFIYLQLKQ